MVTTPTTSGVHERVSARSKIKEKKRARAGGNLITYSRRTRDLEGDDGSAVMFFALTGRGAGLAWQRSRRAREK
jgi:hypothetical protein